MGPVGPQGLTGDTGPMGPEGPIGPQGIQGSSYNTFEYVSDYTSFVAPPPVGGVRFNNANRTLATKAWVSNTTNAGANVKNFLALANSNDTLFVQTTADADRYQVYTIQSAVQLTGYIEFNINWNRSGTLPMLDVSPTIVSVVKK